MYLRLLCCIASQLSGERLKALDSRSDISGLTLLWHKMRLSWVRTTSSLIADRACTRFDIFPRFQSIAFRIFGLKLWVNGFWAMDGHWLS